MVGKGLLLLMVVGLARARDSSKNVSATIGDSSIGNATEKLLVVKPTKVVEWKSGRQRWSKDSYLDAWRHSRTSTDPREGVVATDATGSGSPQRRREYTLGPIYVSKEPESTATAPRIVHGSIDRDSFSMAPSDSYSLPTRTAGDFGGPQNSYGPPQPPQSSYGPPQMPQSTYGPPQPPQSSYGPPQPPRISYGPPSNGYYGDPSGGSYLPPQQAYGPPSNVYGASVPYGNGVPHGMAESSHLGLPSIDFSWPFALKLNAFTLAKILLKLVIFKMIVKFIAVICLLLFIPKLEIKKDKGDMEDEGRHFSKADSRFENELNVLTSFVSNAVDKYQKLNETRSRSKSEFATLGRRLHGAFSYRETWRYYEQLLKSYVSEETRPLSSNS
ncbi:uncharacterized protein LOC122405095 isoform X2 [Colletes gigas]|uniref:uncharacterized protein LOC122405095 isoform X2 n=1 Tax=Colletes gigas TaxID=935657 RepID=UPI001C9A9F04|nr:uncharacterized protein LOC122405095 isoform X2 [Colletes gigas]